MRLHSTVARPDDEGVRVDRTGSVEQASEVEWGSAELGHKRNLAQMWLVVKRLVPLSAQMRGVNWRVNPQTYRLYAHICAICPENGDKWDEGGSKVWLSS